MNNDKTQKKSKPDAGRIQRRRILVNGAKMAAVVVTLHATPARADPALSAYATSGNYG